MENLTLRYRDEFIEVNVLFRRGPDAAFRARNKLDKKLYFIKRLAFLRTEDSEIPDSIRRELNALIAVDHKNVIRYYSSWIERPGPNYTYPGDDGNELAAGMSYEFMFIHMEVVEKSLRDFLSERNQKDVIVGTEELNYFHQIADGVSYIHGKGFMHRDLKPENIYLTSTGTVKICNFSAAILIDDDTQERERPVGSLPYVSPEQLNGNGGYTERTDIFSLGVILFELAYPMKTEQQRDNVLTNLRNGVFPAEFISFNADCVEEIKPMIEKNPAGRKLVSRPKKFKVMPRGMSDKWKPALSQMLAIIVIVLIVAVVIPWLSWPWLVKTGVRLKRCTVPRFLRFDLN